MVHDELPQADSATWCRVHRGNQVSHQLYVARVFLLGFLLRLAELIGEFDTSVGTSYQVQVLLVL